MVRRSLKWRIASVYAILLIVVLVATSGVIVLRFQAILWDQMQAGADRVMSEIVSAAESGTNPFALNGQPTDPAQALLSTNSLSYWESPTTFVQIDSATGYPLNKTANLGVLTIPPNTALQQQHDKAYREVRLGARPFLVEDRLVQVGNTKTVVHVAEPLDALNRTFAQTRQAIGLILLAATILVVVLSFALASQMTEPINLLAATMREIGSEQLGRRVALRGRHDEVGQLAETFNALLARLEEAFARERQFISDASHELKTPLTSINANAQMLLRWGAADATVLRESLQTIAGESATLAGMVNGMLTLAKADRGDDIPKEPVALLQAAQEAVRAAQSRASEKGLSLDLEAPGEPPVVYGDAALLRQLVTNLIENAIKFTNEGSVRVTVRNAGQDAIVEVRDTGPGISENELGRVFERFYRADRSRSREVAGTGLGLAIVRSIARVHGGNVLAESPAGGGALFRVRIPRISLTALS